MSGRGRPRTPDILTPREWEVVDLLREGLSNREIAARLEISLGGAKFHVSEIISKLGVSTREEAASWRPRQPFAAWLPAPAILGGLRLTAGVAVLSATVIGLIAFSVALSSESVSPVPEVAAPVPTALPRSEAGSSATPIPQAPWGFQGPTTALPALAGHVTSAGELTAVAGDVLSVDFVNPGVREVALLPETTVFGAIGHSIVIDDNHARLGIGDGILIRYDSPQPSDPSTWRVLQVVRNYFKYMTGRVVAVGDDYLDILNIEPPLRVPGAADVVTRVYVDPNARMETGSIDGARFPPAPLVAIEVQPGMQATFEGVIADDGSPVAIWVQLH
jgi:DNA-binding CsgD family transcriptional regulator